MIQNNRFFMLFYDDEQYNINYIFYKTYRIIMGDIDSDTLDWLKSMKLANNVQYISDFQNGYYLGLIFDRLNLSKGRKFKNTKDMACKFQNFKNIRDLLFQNFRVQFPIQNILFNTQKLLLTIKECVQQYNREKKQATFKRISNFSESKIQPQQEKNFNNRHREIMSSSKLNQTSKFPKKIQQIQQKLQKFKQIKTKHELIALQDRKNELEEHRRLIQQHRLYQINKIKTNHDFIKEHERKVYDVCDKTMQIRNKRIQVDNNLQSFLQQKKKKFYQSLRDEQSNNFKEGLQAFQLNCIRQGIQLQHDPNKPLRKTEESFNKQVVLQRIKDNVKIHDHQRKQRIKRQNKKAVDAKEANLKAQAIWNETNLVQNYANKINKQLQKANLIRKQINREQAQKINISKKIKNKKIVELAPVAINQQVRNEQYRKRKIEYLDSQVVRLQRRQKKHKIIAENALQALINIVIQNEDMYTKNNGFTFFQWKSVENQFLIHQKQEKKAKDKSKFIDNSYHIKAKDFVSNRGEWQIKNFQNKQILLSKALQFIIDKAYPRKSPPQNLNLPLYMPLKISFIGDSLSGKTTLAQKLVAKYGIVLINPVQVINQAFQLNKEPVVEDPKKKKDSKKPEQENPEKIALKQWGEKLMKKLSNPSSATIDHYLQAIKFKLNYNFQNKSKSQILKQFEQSKVQQGQRLAKALKQYEELQKKGKKDAKKGGIQQVEEVPSQRKYFYTKGFLIDGLNLNKETISSIQEKLNGYLSFQETINKNGQNLKQKISDVIIVRQAQKDNRLQPGFFDFLFQLQANNDILQSRQVNDKRQLVIVDKKQVRTFYQDFGHQAFKIKSYQQIKNESTVEQSLNVISRTIESYLDNKYSQILSQNIKSLQSEVIIPQVDQTSPQNHILSLCSSVQQKAGLALMQRFTIFYEAYYSKVLQNISEYDNERRVFESKFLQIQQTFINIINRPDDKAGKILNFQQNYNKLLLQKTNIVKDTQASKHLISKLDQLYDTLWISLENKKNQAVNQRSNFLHSNALNHQVNKLVEISKKLIENQLNLLVQVVFFIYALNNYVSGCKEQVLTEYLVLGIPPQMEPIASFQSQTYISPRLQYYINQASKCLKDLPQWLSKKEKKFKITRNQTISLVLQQFIENSILKIQQKMKIIRERVKQMYLQYFCLFNIMANKMDDWIIQGIKYQNEFVYDIYKNIKKNIQEAKKSNIKDLFVKDITDLIHPLYNLPINRLPVTFNTPQSKIKLLSFTIFMHEIKCLATNGRIPFKLFCVYFEKRKKSKLLDHQYLNIQVDLMQQYLVTDDYLNLREVLLAMLLWNVKILEEDEINAYENSLKIAKEEDQQYFKEKISLQQFKMIPGVATNPQESKVLKAFIFQIFSGDYQNLINIKDYLQTLRLFCQLQVYNYGDTIIVQRHSPSRIQKRP